MGANELLEWHAYYSLEPFGQWRDNFHSAQIATLINNSHVSKRSDVRQVSDFMYRTLEEDILIQQKRSLGRIFSHSG